ncbi:prefoldin subunit beta [Candidatus Woesearchaeota archaeon]|nr:prefoldin subunit beta [Candidatus Woesearchaeota archaeon]
MAVPKEVEEKIEQLQLFEQNLQGMMLQKQSVEMQLFEVGSALAEMEKAESVYRIIGNVMVSAKKEDVKADLEAKRETAGLRIQTIEKQEKLIRERASKLQKEVLGAIGEGKED